ncbi:hypothetical protein [Entomospira culicis]|uniref:CD-NTase-associated protein 15 domain-containing protein n=1 Tax=Entomospira culicis TaxID=2719989 RepID=A0A968GFY2_9SPIO|nr:hypothetical protein [Entomospira culicis]NIZ19114.1 hypothetical protein [Entomospira culicis]NIZ69328.1 hypothetical protein [Entomospira culicis]WDI37914.1 hypothetical protein PVA46_03755 [Entomospira culicis]WDI39541.1 hypothetical protein PVA47_03755 [Entomospira culicis]
MKNIYFEQRLVFTCKLLSSYFACGACKFCQRKTHEYHCSRISEHAIDATIEIEGDTVRMKTSTSESISTVSAFLRYKNSIRILYSYGNIVSPDCSHSMANHSGIAEIYLTLLPNIRVAFVRGKYYNGNQRHTYGWINGESYLEDAI